MMNDEIRMTNGAGQGRSRVCAWGRVCALVLLLSLCVGSVQAVQVQDITRMKGAEGSKLVGMGLVVGLDGTGDGGNFLPAMRPLAEVIGQLIDPNVVAAELSNADNVALVSLSADVPAQGTREGNRVDVHVSSVGPADSLEGGRLFLIPMTGPLPGSGVYAFAEGPVSVEGGHPTTGVVRDGGQLTRDVFTRFMDEHGRITLVINDANASWPVANNLSSLINGLISPDGPDVARAVDAKNVIVQVPEYEQENPAAFISQILQTYIDPSQVSSGARVVINERTGTIVISGDVRISPVIISHNGLTITAVNNGAGEIDPALIEEAAGEPFLAMDPDERGGAELESLLQAFNQLKVDAQDRIEIIKLMHDSGKLHGQLILE